jgi:hypothetical protein
MLAGVAGVLLGLAIYQWGDRWRLAVKKKSLPPSGRSVTL